jgi:hypothetical protein
MRTRESDATGSSLQPGQFGLIMATAEAIDMVGPTPIRQSDRRLANFLGTHAGTSPWNGKLPRRESPLPVHRSILAVDIEGSTQRTNTVKGELREQVYRLVMGALGMAGIDSQHYDPLTDRGDGVLVLLRPADEFPKPLLLSRLMPALASLLAAYNSSVSPDEQPRILRLRAVVHAGEVHCDGKGFFGEDLDVAFRLLDAPQLKAYLRSEMAPLALVASDYIYHSIIRHGYDGIDDEQFLQLVTVKVGDQRRRGWVHLPRAERLTVALPARACAS